MVSFIWWKLLHGFEKATHKVNICTRAKLRLPCSPHEKKLAPKLVFSKKYMAPQIRHK